MTLFQLVYASKLTEGVSAAEIAGMLDRAAIRNRDSAVSGLICYSPKYFLQVLEGPRHAVNATLSRIIADKRHHDIVVLSAGEIIRRDFSNWSMGYMSGVESKRELYFRYGCGDEFDPMQLSSVSALSLLKEAATLLEKSGQRSTAPALGSKPIAPGTFVMAG